MLSPRTSQKKGFFFAKLRQTDFFLNNRELYWLQRERDMPLARANKCASRACLLSIELEDLNIFILTEFLHETESNPLANSAHK
jgi:hypothetical protein